MFTLGIGVTAYTLGLRHAFDADHIAAIDNTTRKLMRRASGRSASVSGSRSATPRSCSRSRLDLVGVRALDGPVKNDNSSLHQVTNWIGTLVSGSFLYMIAALNIVILLGIIKVFREMKQRPLRRAGARGAAQQPRIDEPLLRQADQDRHQARSRCTRSGCCSGLGSTPRPRSRCS